MAQTAQQPGPAFKHGHIEADGFRIRYSEAGQGNPVVIMESSAWALSKLRDSLAENYRVFSFELPGELPGLENSQANAEPQSVKDLANTAAQAVAMVVPDKYTLIGTSFGANVALWQALQTPEPVEALILISPTSILPEAGPKVGTPEEIASLLFTHPENLESWPTADPSIAAKIRELVERLRSSAHDAVAESKLVEIQCPTLVVFGANDKMVTSGAGRIYGEKIPNINVSIVYDAGHLIEAERPEALINAVADFVERRETFVVGRQSSMINAPGLALASRASVTCQRLMYSRRLGR